MVKNSALLLGLTLVWVGMAEQVSAQVELNQGDRVVFLGDSITQAGARPGGYVSLFRQAVDDQLGKARSKSSGLESADTKCRIVKNDSTAMSFQKSQPML